MAIDRALESEVDYIRTMAEAGRRAPLLGGAHLAATGTLTSAAFVGHWAILNGHAPADVPVGVAFWGLWFAYGGLMGVALTLLNRRIRTRPGASSVSNQAEGMIWGALCWALSAVAFGSIGHMLVTGDTGAVNTIPPAAFALYGVGLIGSSHFSDEKHLKVFGVLAAAISLILFVFADAAWLYLAAAAGVLAVLVAPGAILMSREPRDVV